MNVTAKCCLAALALNGASVGAAPKDIRTVRPDLAIPGLSEGAPAPGKRVRQTHPDHAQSPVYHVLYLPSNWKPGKKYPVIVEYNGNGGFKSKLGDVCTGKVEDSKLGYGISKGEDFIWLCLPYLNGAGTANVTKWWGTKPSYNPESTVAYCKKTVPWICERYGGDPSKVILAGFSRGSIACNYIGLHDDEIARLWCGFVPYSVYDGVGRKWPYPNSGREAAIVRLRRLGNRPQFICDETSDAKSSIDLNATKAFLRESGVKGNFTFASTGFENHNDAWILHPSRTRTKLRRWVARLVR